MQNRISPGPPGDHRPPFHPEIRDPDGRHRAAHQDPLGPEPGTAAPVDRDGGKPGKVPESEKDCPENRWNSETRRSSGC